MREIDPNQTNRAEAFRMWMQAPMPMVTLTKTLDVTHLVRLSRRHGCGFNPLLCWCIGRAASAVPEFFLLPAGEKMLRYDRLALSAVVETKDGGITTCDVPFSEPFSRFHADYLALTERAARSGEMIDRSGDCMVIGTSALIQTELDSAVNIYAGCYNNPFVIWGKYRKILLSRKYRKPRIKASLPVSFQFHHTQMDGAHAARFLENLQQCIRGLRL